MSSDARCPIVDRDIFEIIEAYNQGALVEGEQGCCWVRRFRPGTPECQEGVCRDVDWCMREHVVLADTVRQSLANAVPAVRMRVNPTIPEPMVAHVEERDEVPEVFRPLFAGIQGMAGVRMEQRVTALVLHHGGDVMARIKKPMQSDQLEVHIGACTLDELKSHPAAKKIMFHTHDQRRLVKREKLLFFVYPETIPEGLSLLETIRQAIRAKREVYGPSRDVVR